MTSIQDGNISRSSNTTQQKNCSDSHYKNKRRCWVKSISRRFGVNTSWQSRFISSKNILKLNNSSDRYYKNKRRCWVKSISKRLRINTGWQSHLISSKSALKLNSCHGTRGGTWNNGYSDSRSEHIYWNSFIYSKDINLQEDVIIISSVNMMQLPYI